MATSLLIEETCEELTLRDCVVSGRHTHDRAPLMNGSPHPVWGHEGCERPHLIDTGAGANRYGARTGKRRRQKSEMLSPAERLFQMKRAE